MRMKQKVEIAKEELWMFFKMPEEIFLKIIYVLYFCPTIKCFCVCVQALEDSMADKNFIATTFQT